MNFTESEVQHALRAAVADLGARYGFQYTRSKVKSGQSTDELWLEAGKLGFLGVNLPEQYGGGGGGMYELSLVLEELSAAGCSQLMMVVSPAICGTVIAKYGSDEQKLRWLPGIADGSLVMAFGITEPDAGSNSHNIATTARRREGTGGTPGDEGAAGGWLLTGRKIYVSGVDRADAVLVVARTEGARTGRLEPVLFAVPTDSPGFQFSPIEMDLATTDKQFMLFLDDVRLPADALIGQEHAAMAQLFAGLNPERIMAAALSVGIARYALDKAVAYAKQRVVWGAPIGSHQGLAHPLAQVKIELEQAKLMMQKAATLYDLGEDLRAGEAANMAKYAAAEVAVRSVDQ
ncbi:MAG: acyl-CoA dehydrogenase family protein, partial [Pseudonocardiales bacterium]